MIFGVWIIHRVGKCLIFREYKSLNINEQLFSGFLVAILSFSKEIGGRELKKLTLEELTLYYENIEAHQLVFVIAADSQEREAKIREKISLIEEAFLQEYKEILPTWESNISIFATFSPKIDEIVKSKGRHVSLIDFNFFNRASFEAFFEKFSLLLGKKNKKEIDKLENTVGIIDELSERKENFNVASFILDTHKKMSKTIKNMIEKIYQKKD